MSQHTAGPQMGYEKMLLTAICDPIAGASGPLRSCVELVYNSQDAGAHRMQIISSNQGGVPIAIFRDGGAGVSAAGENAIMSYFNSNKDGSSTIGKHGTGLKNMLGLVRNPSQDIRKTKILVQTVSKHRPEVMTEFHITFDYLLRLAEIGTGTEAQAQAARAWAEQHTKRLPIPQGWSQFGDMTRKTGTDVILYGCDLINIKTLINQLATELTPETAERIEVWDGKVKKQLRPVVHDGEEISYSTQKSLLGKVRMELFCPSGQRGKTLLCTDKHTICDLSEIAKQIAGLPLDLQPLLMNTAGWIYIQHLNTWRSHASRLKQEFYMSGAANELVQCLLEILPEVQKHLNVSKKDVQVEHLGMLEELMQVFGTLTPIGTGVQGIFGRLTRQPKPTQARTELEVQFVPDELAMYPDDTLPFKIKEIGTLVLDPKQWIWDDSNSPIKVMSSKKGLSVELMAGERQVTGYFILTHPKLPKRDFKIKSIVTTRPDPKISGPTKVISGREYEFKLKHFPSDLFSWDMVSPRNWHKGVVAGARAQGQQTIVLNVKPVAQKTSLTLRVMRVAAGGGILIDHPPIVQKIIEIYPPEEQQPKDRRIVICGQQFIIMPQAMQVNGALAHPGTIMDTIPSIGINFNSSVLDTSLNKKQALFSAILQAALPFLLSRNIITPADWPRLYEEFMISVAKRMKF